MNRVEQAVEYKHKGNNCCQAVLMAYADVLPVPVEVLRQMGAAFGVGMGCMESTCGALCGAQMVLGMVKYQGKPVLSDAREVYRIFAEKCGATLCCELKGLKTGKMICSCDDCVRHGVEAVEAYVADEGKGDFAYGTDVIV